MKQREEQMSTQKILLFVLLLTGFTVLFGLNQSRAESASQPGDDLMTVEQHRLDREALRNKRTEAVRRAEEARKAAEADQDTAIPDEPSDQGTQNQNGSY